MKTTRRGFLGMVGAAIAGMVLPRGGNDGPPPEGKAKRCKIEQGDIWHDLWSNPEFEGGKQSWGDVPKCSSGFDEYGAGIQWEGTRELGGIWKDRCHAMPQGYVAPRPESVTATNAGLGDGGTWFRTAFGDIPFTDDQQGDCIIDVAAYIEAELKKELHVEAVRELEQWENEILYGNGSAEPQGIIRAGDHPLCRLFTANDDAALVGEIYLNGKDVADDCVVKWEKSEDDTAGPRDDDLNECVFLDENGAIIVTHDCHVVDMEQSTTADRLDDFVEAIARNSEKLQEQLERQADPDFWTGWQYAKLKYCHDAMCLPSELTQAQERQAFLNYTMEYYS